MDKSSIIGKYALLLIVFYAIQFSYTYLLQIFSPAISYNVSNFLSGYYFRIILIGILNIITAFIVWDDVKKYELKIKYLPILTLLFRPLGVCLFLIGLMAKENDNK
jgi:hypothetical protein